MHEVAILEAIVIVILIITVIRQARIINEIQEHNEELLEKTEEQSHNHTVIIEEDRKIRSLLIAIENIIFGKRTAEEKVNKIKELLNIRQNNNSN